MPQGPLTASSSPGPPDAEARREAPTGETAISRRKREHVQVALSLTDPTGAGWDDVHIAHHALPDIDLDEVELTSSFLGRTLTLPLVVPGMTGAHDGAIELNAVLARMAERTGIAIGVGSQRAALLHPSLARSFEVVRTMAPTAFVIANIGVSQLVHQPGGAPLDADGVRAIVDMVGADALAIHLNFLEEAVQPEGQTRAQGCLAAIRTLVEVCPVPVIAKETGCGLSRQAALLLAQAGVAALDVGGRGGTSFLQVESARAVAQGDDRRVAVGAPFATWGLPTAVSVASCAPVLPTLAVGGVRSGLDAAKALALGAVAVGVGRPLLERAAHGEDALSDWVETFRQQLRLAVFLSGARRASDLSSRPRVVLGDTGRWLDQLSAW